MKDELNVLHISPDFNYVCGVSKYIYLLFKGIKSNETAYKVNLFFITNGGDSLDRLETIGVKPVIMNFTKGWKNIFYINDNLKELEKFCRVNQIDIIHTHHRYPELLANILKRKLNIKTITTVHSLVDGYKKLSFKSDKIIAVSKAVERNLIEKFGVEKEQVIQIYNPIDWEEYRNTASTADKTLIGLPKDSKLFLFVGRYSKLKGVDILIKVFLNIYQTYNNVYLILITDVPGKEKKRILSKSKNIVFIKPQKDISYFYRISDAVVLPSKKESFPFVMLEAGIYRKLFIGSDVGGITEFIRDNQNGLKFTANDPTHLEKIIREVISNDFNFSDLIENNYKKIKQLFDIQAYVEQLNYIYYHL